MKFALNRNWLVLGVAVVIGGAAAFGINRYIKRQIDDLAERNKGRMVQVVVPKEDLAKGTALAANLVAVREIPIEWSHSNVITPEQFGRVENQRLAYPVAHGEMLMWSLLEGQRTASFSSRLPPGRRAITVPVDEVNSISGMLEPNDRIDLMVSVRKDSHSYMFPLLQNVAVLATGSRVTAVVDADGRDAKRTFTTITLEASPEEAQTVLAAREVGKIAALLRPPGDVARSSSERRDAMALLGIGPPPTEPGESTVPVLYGGRGALPAGSKDITPGRAVRPQKEHLPR